MIELYYNMNKSLFYGEVTGVQTAVVKNSPHFKWGVPFLSYKIGQVIFIFKLCTFMSFMNIAHESPNLNKILLINSADLAVTTPVSRTPSQRIHQQTARHTHPSKAWSGWHAHWCKDRLKGVGRASLAEPKSRTCS
jgi:hypothetical protein